MTYTLLLYPQPDPIIRESSDREKLLEVISDESFDVFLPGSFTETDHWPTHFAVHTSKQGPSLTFWEIIPRFQYVKKWETYLPLPVVGIIFLLSDPKLHNSSDNEMVNLLAADQKMLTSAMINEIRGEFDVPIIFVYMKRWPDSLQIEELLEANLILDTHQLSYSADDLFNLPTDIANILRKQNILTDELPNREWLPSIGVGKNMPETYVKKVWSHLRNTFKDCTIWLEVKEVPLLKNDSTLNERKLLIGDPLHHLKYMDYAVSIPHIETENRIKKLIPPYYMYLECEGKVYSSIDSIWGTLPLETFQSRLNSTQRVYQLISPNMEESHVAKIINQMVELHRQ